MGGSSKSTSTQYSSQSSFSQGLYGDNSGVMLGGDNNRISMNITDRGAIEGALGFANDFGSVAMEANLNSNNNLASIASSGLELANQTANDAFSLSNSLTSSGFELANESMSNNTNLASDAMNNSANLASDAMNNSAGLASDAMNNSASLASDGFSFADSVFNTGAQLINESNSNTLDAALSMHNTGLQQLQLGTDFVTQLNQQSLDASANAQADNNNALLNGFKNTMQFVDDFSRSDGAAVASTNMKTIGLLSLAAVGVAFALKKG